MKKDTDEFDMGELDLEELELEDDRDLEEELGDEFEDWTEEQKPLKPGTMILVFLGLVVLAAIICAILWNFTHRDSADSGNPGDSAEMSQEATEDWHAVSFDVVSGEGIAVSEIDSDEASPLPDEGTDFLQEQEDNPESAAASETEDNPESAAVSGTEDSPESAAASEAESDDANRVSTKDGRVIVFTNCDDVVSPKEYVNLRLEPSTSEGNATVHCRLNYGETVHRTGISEDSGWSRVEKDGVVCYVVTSFVYVVEEAQ